MAISQPLSTDLLNSPDHSLMHRQIATDPITPAQSLKIDASGNITASGVGMFSRLGIAGVSSDPTSGIYGEITATGTDIKYGTNFVMSTTADASSQTVYGHRSYIGTFSGASDVGYGYLYEVNCSSTGGTQYGLMVDADWVGAVVDTFYGVYIKAGFLSSTTKWGIYVEDVDSYFGGDIVVSGGDITGSTAAALDVQAGVPTDAAGNNLNLIASSGVSVAAGRSGGAVAITAGDATAADMDMAGNGGSITLTCGDGASLGTPGPANTGGSFTVNLGTYASAPDSANGIASIVLNDGVSSNAVLDVLSLTRSYASTAAANIGVGFTLKTEDASGNIEEAGNIDALFPTATHSGQTARVNIGTLGTNVLGLGTFGTNLWTVPVPPAAGTGNGFTLTASNGVTNGAGGAIAITAGNAAAGGGAGYSGGAITLTGGTGAASGPPTAHGGDINLVGGAGANTKGDVLIDAGLTVGSTTKAGDNNLRVEGTSALVGTVTCTGSFIVKTVNDAGMDGTNGTVAEIVFNSSDISFYGCSVTGTPATWVKLG